MFRPDEEDAVVPMHAPLRPWTAPAVAVERFADAVFSPSAGTDGIYGEDPS